VRAHGPARGGRRLGGVPGGADGQFAQVLVFGVVQLQGAGVDDGGTGPGLLAAFQAYVVVDADPGERGQLLAAQAGGAAKAGTDREADLFGCGPGAAGTQEPAQLGAAVAALLCSDAMPLSVTPL
jgi:hypothetical protein